MYYIGFLKNDHTHGVVFRSATKPKRIDYLYFLNVVGPYKSWDAAKNGLKLFRGYKENPVKNGITKKDITKAIGLTKRVIRMFGALRKKNPVPIGKFLSYMKQLEKLVVGSKEYAQVLAKAYQEVQAIKGK
mgnify:CR=1 FL=1